FFGWLVLGITVGRVSGTPVRTLSLNYALMSYAILLGIELALFSTPGRLRRVAVGFLAGATVAALLGTSQVLFGGFPGDFLLEDGRAFRGQLYIPGSRRLAATGTLHHRLKMSEMWLVAIAILVAGLLGQKRRWLVVLGLAVTGVFLGLTFTKAALGAAVIAVTAGLVAVRWPRLGGWILGALVAGLLLIWPVAVSVGLNTTPTLPVPRGSLEVRPWLWSFAADLFLTRPIFGGGIGTYFFASQAVVISGNESHMFGAHQQLFTIAVEAGVVGVFLFSGSLFASGIGIARGLVRNHAGRTLAVFAFTLLVAIGVTAVMHDVIFHPGTALVFWLAVGVGLGLAPRGTES
ncbi:MAG: O-antigen ligase family protein, partial [Myxococcota bacterium]